MATLNTSKSLLCALTLACAASGSAMAYEPMSFSPYIGANYGYLDINDSDFDDESDAYQFRAGAKIFPFLAVEAGYNDFGDFGAETSSLDVDGYSLALVGRLPVTETFGLYAKAGQLWWDAEYNLGELQGDSSEDDFFFGVGAEMELMENLDVVFAYDRYKVEATYSAGLLGDGNYEADVNLASIGLNLSF